MLKDSLLWRIEGFTPLHFVARYGIRRNKMIVELASEVKKEKLALEELNHAWATHNPSVHLAEWESGQYRDCTKQNYSM